MDIIYVSGLPFLIMRLGNVDLRSIQRLTSRSMNVIAKGLEVVINKHSRRGFNITDFHADPEFDKRGFHNFLMPGTLHICSREEHIGPIERDSRKIQERARCAVHSLQYKKYPILMIIALLERIKFWLNSFLSET